MPADALMLRAYREHDKGKKEFPDPVEHRRRAPRIPTDWLAWFRLEDQPASEWRACGVVDISLIGVGAVISGEVSDDLVGRRLHIQVEAPIGGSVRLYLLGRVANQTKVTEGTRVGLEFTDLSETEKAILQVVEQLKFFW